MDALADRMDGAAVAAWLRANPAFLAENPALYFHLAPPERVHGTVLADHMAAMLRAARAEANCVVAAGRAAAGLANRVQEAVLLLIGATDVADCVIAAFPPALAIDAAGICAESMGETSLPGHRSVPRGYIEAVMGHRDVQWRSGATDSTLHGEAARLAAHEALIRIPGTGPPALLALAARDSLVLDPAQGAGALAFLGRALAVALGR